MLLAVLLLLLLLQLLLVILGTLEVFGASGVQDEHALVLYDLEHVAQVGAVNLPEVGTGQRLLVALVVELSGHDSKVQLVVGAHPGIVQLLSLVLEDDCLADSQNGHGVERHLKESLNEVLPLAEQIPCAFL